MLIHNKMYQLCQHNWYVFSMNLDTHKYSGLWDTSAVYLPPDNIDLLDTTFLFLAVIYWRGKDLI